MTDNVQAAKREAMLAKKRAYYAANRNKELERVRKRDYYLVNKDLILERNKAWRAKNRLSLKVSRNLLISVPQARKLLQQKGLV